jgi:hypothetical protein
MGVLTDIYIANVDEAEALGTSENTFEDFVGIDIKGFDTTLLEALYEIITGKKGKIEMIFEATEEGPWVFETPKDFVPIMAKLAKPELETVSAKLLKQNESLQLDGYDSEGVKNVLQEITGIAQKAQSKNKGLLVWMSL